jgi:UDP-glucose:glycoprotein glucosyltransferase
LVGRRREVASLDPLFFPLRNKEEKLKRAKRLIPEWTVYDDEVAALARRVESSSFSAKADELGQAVEQKKEREEEEEKNAPAAMGGEGRIKDEL